METTPLKNEQILKIGNNELGPDKIESFQDIMKKLTPNETQGLFLYSKWLIARQKLDRRDTPVNRIDYEKATELINLFEVNHLHIPPENKARVVFDKLTQSLRGNYSHGREEYELKFSGVDLAELIINQTHIPPQTS